MNTPLDKTKREFLVGIADLLENARKTVKAHVNLTMVYTYYEIGRRIVIEEQKGADRAEYGKKLLKELSAFLTAEFGKGFSVGNLKNIRQFYKVYSEDQIGETVLSQFEDLPTVSTGRRFYISWSHDLKLMRISNIDERHFYEIESVNWVKRNVEAGFLRLLGDGSAPFGKGEGYAQAELSPRWVERNVEAGFLRLPGDSSAGGVTVPWPHPRYRFLMKYNYLIIFGTDKSPIQHKRDQICQERQESKVSAEIIM